VSKGWGPAGGVTGNALKPLLLPGLASLFFLFPPPMVQTGKLRHIVGCFFFFGSSTNVHKERDSHGVSNINLSHSQLQNDSGKDLPVCFTYALQFIKITFLT
jgi:hypothetical protein